MNPEFRVLDAALIHWVSPFTFLHLFPKGETWSSKKTQKSDLNTTLSCSSPPAITIQAHADPSLPHILSCPWRQGLCHSSQQSRVWRDKPSKATSSEVSPLPPLLPLWASLLALRSLIKVCMFPTSL